MLNVGYVRNGNYKKKKTTLYKERKEEKHEEYKRLIENIPIEEMIYLVDGCGVEDSCYREYGRAIVGEKMHGEINGKRAAIESV